MFSDSIALFQFFGFGTITVKGEETDNGKTVTVTNGSLTQSAKIANQLATFKKLPGKKDYTVKIANGSTVEKTSVESLGFGESKVVYTTEANPINKLNKDLSKSLNEMSEAFETYKEQINQTLSGGTKMKALNYGGMQQIRNAAGTITAPSDGVCHIPAVDYFQKITIKGKAVGGPALYPVSKGDVIKQNGGNGDYYVITYIPYA